YVLQFSSRTNLPKVNRKEIAGFRMPLPPLVLQNQFADFVTQVDKSKFAGVMAMRFYQTLQNSLRQEWMRCQTLNF
ncbi:MAG: restriction endonuclease subunit S, partial [Peptococcaceae bacterium]|nr:restriction endonuclease subunit S [Peptococcaceae bacterium]